FDTGGGAFRPAQCDGTVRTSRRARHRRGPRPAVQSMISDRSSDVPGREFRPAQSLMLGRSPVTVLPGTLRAPTGWRTAEKRWTRSASAPAVRSWGAGIRVAGVRRGTAG